MHSWLASDPSQGEDLLRFFGNALDFARNEPLGTNVGRSCSLKLNRFTDCFVYFFCASSFFLSFLKRFQFDWLMDGFMKWKKLFDFVFEIFGDDYLSRFRLNFKWLSNKFVFVSASRFSKDMKNL